MRNKLLIVNADDFGLGSGVNKGIVDAFRAGAVTNATLLVKGAGAGEAFAFALENPDLCVGLHLDLDDVVCGKATGAGRFEKEWLAERLGNTGNLAAVEEEIESQIALFRRKGLPLTHIDGHHHLHALPQVFPIVVRKMAEHGIKTVRFAESYDLIKYPPLEPDAAEMAAMAALMEDKGILRADHFIARCGMDVVKDVGEGVTELMAHPGMEEGWRRRDLDIIMSPEWTRRLDAAGISLISFRDLIKKGADQ